MAFTEWDPAVYGRRASERARPFVELVARVGAEPATVRAITDVGCGPGHLTLSLADRYPNARITGLDSSPAMIAEAVPTDRVRFEVGDATTYLPGPDADLVVSNAVLHWIDGHPDLLRRWADHLRPGAWLAVQVPGNRDARSHVAVRELSADVRWRDRLTGVAESGPVLDPAGYAAVVAASGCDPDAWETTYLHTLPAEGDVHPVLTWLEGTTLRPVIAALGPDEYPGFAAALTERLRADYPVADGRFRYPFRRVFVVAEKIG
ncbi:methyltransferase domain-containing protein [Cryptosporangium phraense]|uniref:Methyltransferase domain-containing protein n=1 Tax=Cryptosporangium phraense TaxID=2593070 RepID=A0A545AGP1_9ACTN|nr:methyltransferase domain-containing protein [Cryptosporangium phraense]TQS40498.1 methyltransferase domain-containing protein [Cryptosporangium phraense]